MLLLYNENRLPAHACKTRQAAPQPFPNQNICANISGMLPSKLRLLPAASASGIDLEEQFPALFRWIFIPKNSSIYSSRCLKMFKNCLKTVFTHARHPALFTELFFYFFLNSNSLSFNRRPACLTGCPNGAAAASQTSSASPISAALELFLLCSAKQFPSQSFSPLHFAVFKMGRGRERGQDLFVPPSFRGTTTRSSNPQSHPFSPPQMCPSIWGSRSIPERSVGRGREKGHSFYSFSQETNARFFPHICPPPNGKCPKSPHLGGNIFVFGSFFFSKNE
jgi:hypothetical protein